MSGAGFEKEGLSRAEIRALLGDEPAVESGEEPPPLAPGEEFPPRGEVVSPARVLLVSRRSADTRLVGARLQSLGAAVDVVRNPFSALDKLRAGSYGAVVSDLALWANDGSLLLKRLRASGRNVPVLLLVDPEAGETEGALARRAGAWSALGRPFHAGKLEKTVRDLLAAAREAALARGFRSGDEKETAFGEGTGPRRGEAPLLSESGPPPGEAAELRWLRFFLESNRLLRTAGSDPGALARLLLKELAPGAVGLFYYRGDGATSACFESSAGPDRSSLQRLVDSSAGEALEPTTLVVTCPASLGETCLVLDRLPPGVHAAAGDFLEDLRDLLGTWFEEMAP